MIIVITSMTVATVPSRNFPSPLAGDFFALSHSRCETGASNRAGFGMLLANSAHCHGLHCCHLYRSLSSQSCSPPMIAIDTCSDAYERRPKYCVAESDCRRWGSALPVSELVKIRHILKVRASIGIEGIERGLSWFKDIRFCEDHYCLYQ